MDVRHGMELYQQAALVHDQAAEFWDRRGRPEKAAAERERAELNRFYADFEAVRLCREWGALPDGSPAKSPTPKPPTQRGSGESPERAPA